MHIDAVLEFIVEYPQSWSKDRRLSYGSKEGEVRWSHPDQPQTLLKIKSYLQKQPALSSEQQVDQVLREYVAMEETDRAKVVLPAGEALHITGHTAEENIDIHLLLRAERNYLIVFTSSPDNFDAFEEVLERVTDSFLAMPSNKEQEAKLLSEPRKN